MRLGWRGLKCWPAFADAIVWRPERVTTRSEVLPRPATSGVGSGRLNRATAGGSSGGAEVSRELRHLPWSLGDGRGFSVGPSGLLPRAVRKRDNLCNSQPWFRLLPWGCRLSRKYGQKGYQDSGEKKVFTPSQSAARSKDLTFGPRPIQMPGSRSVSRCAMCGTVLGSVDVQGQCVKCSAELHSCRQCNYFDPGGRFECAQPVTARIESKTAKNDCQFFQLRSNLEKETTTGPPKVNTARAAFDALFKK